MVELVDLLHVPEDDELLVDDASWDLLHAAGHLPQVGLAGRDGAVKQNPTARAPRTAAPDVQHTLRSSQIKELG